eukprot:CAMPEP_0116899660 /NCGR_PEP_ID=MMETSP0467-20121206/8170_1 /TAXON_ID=283647 /ORGANISM="Mesodinium pulex, Strain SPMC105" /LENGTH=121 /DNA_ID=CAMNT_0004572585 /DNA_START=1328 /DNA_END=1693 /DNA_ORIENTATION=+
MECPLIKREYTSDDDMYTILKMVVMRILRPDRFISGVEHLKGGKDILDNPMQPLVNVIDMVKAPREEFILCLTNPGFDITDNIVNVAKNFKSVKLNIVSLGKKQNQDQASKKITESLRKGE